MPGPLLRAAALLLLLTHAAGAAEPPALMPRLDVLPPLELASSLDLAALPPGRPVSQPLQPADDDAFGALRSDPYVGRPRLERPANPDVLAPFGPSWVTFEYLVWWPKGQDVPPLVSGTRANAPVVLVGGAASESLTTSGGRFTAGFALNAPGTAALAVTYLFLGSRTTADTVSTLDGRRPRSIGRPFLNAQTGTPDALPVAQPGLWDGGVNASRSTRVSGWEVNALSNLYQGQTLRLDGLAGYRYFQANEGLRVEQLSVFPATGTAVGIADQFDAHNRFHGGQVGLVGGWSHNGLTLELGGKVALGQSINVVRVSGLTVAGPPGSQPEATPAGVLALPTNAGRQAHTTFAVLPETSVKVGYQLGTRSRVTLGYNFLYLSEAVRPGDQVDRTLDPSQIPYLSHTLSNTAERPVPLLVRSDLWVQGITLGLELHY